MTALIEPSGYIKEKTCQLIYGRPSMTTLRSLLAIPAPDAALAGSMAAGLPQIAVSPAQGKLLAVLARAMGVRTILRLARWGYSAICLARALPPDGRLITLEYNPKHAEVARVNIARAGWPAKLK